MSSINPYYLDLCFTKALELSHLYQREVQRCPYPTVETLVFLEREAPQIKSKIELLDKDLTVIATKSEEGWGKEKHETIRKVHFVAQSIIEEMRVEDEELGSVQAHTLIPEKIKEIHESLNPHVKFVRRPNPDSPFYDTDLVIFPDHYREDLPLNGIKKSEFEHIEIYFNERLRENIGNIEIDSSDESFTQSILNDFKILLTRPSSRAMLLFLSSQPDEEINITIRPTNPGEGPSADFTLKYFDQTLENWFSLYNPREFVLEPNLPKTLYYDQDKHQYFYITENLVQQKLIMDIKIVLDHGAQNIKIYGLEKQNERRGMTRFFHNHIILAHELIHAVQYIQRPLHYQMLLPYDINHPEYPHSNEFEKRAILGGHQEGLIGKICENTVRRELGYGTRLYHRDSRLEIYGLGFRSFLQTLQAPGLYEDFVHYLVGKKPNLYDQAEQYLLDLGMFLFTVEALGMNDLHELILYYFDPKQDELPASTVEFIKNEYPAQTLHELESLKDQAWLSGTNLLDQLQEVKQQALLNYIMLFQMPNHSLETLLKATFKDLESAKIENLLRSLLFEEEMAWGEKIKILKAITELDLPEKSELLKPFSTYDLFYSPEFSPMEIKGGPEITQLLPLLRILGVQFCSRDIEILLDETLDFGDQHVQLERQKRIAFFKQNLKDSELFDIVYQIGRSPSLIEILDRHLIIHEAPDEIISGLVMNPFLPTQEKIAIFKKLLEWGVNFAEIRIDRDSLSKWVRESELQDEELETFIASITKRPSSGDENEENGPKVKRAAKAETKE